jgi:hypothetical protein
MNIVRVHIDGPRETAIEKLQALRRATSQGERAQAVVWCPQRWQETNEVTISDDFDVEVPLALNPSEAIERVQRVVANIDPHREVIKGGDFDMTPLPL